MWYHHDRRQQPYLLGRSREKRHQYKLFHAVAVGRAHHFAFNVIRIRRGDCPRDDDVVGNRDVAESELLAKPRQCNDVIARSKRTAWGNVETEIHGVSSFKTGLIQRAPSAATAGLAPATLALRPARVSTTGVSGFAA